MYYYTNNHYTGCPKKEEWRISVPCELKVLFITPLDKASSAEDNDTKGAFMLNFWGQNQRFQTWLEQNAVASMLIFE